MNCNISLCYTIDDDGIYISCDHDWSKNLGYDPTPTQVQDAVKEHDNWILLSPGER